MTDKEKIRNIIELFIAWNGEKDVIDIANIDSAVDFISDSLQVKDADLEKEIKEEYLNRRCRGGKDNMFVILNEPQFNEVAKHFFEFGLKAQKVEYCMEEEIKKLHRMTGLGISECRKAYEKFGNFNASYKHLREKWRGVWTTNSR